MRTEIRVELRDVFGGDGELRAIEKERMTRKKRTKTTIRDSIGVPVDVGTEETSRESQDDWVNTFRFMNNKPVLRLGGAHGKFWGALKTAAKQLYELGDPDFAKSYKAAVDMITVDPAWVLLESKEPMRVEGIPQVMRGNAGMVVQKFDVISKAEVNLILIYPDALENKVKKLLKQIQSGTHLNKRRTTIRILG